MSELVKLKCAACRGDFPKLSDEEIQNLIGEVPEWQVLEEEGIKKLARVYRFKNFREAIQFTDKIAEIAEQEDHHPLIQTEWGKVKLMWWTHKIRGLHKNDFIMAAKSDLIFQDEWMN